MDIIRLEETGLEVSRICFGCMSFGKETEERPWVLGRDEARPMFRKAWEAGINYFDTANVYAAGTSEEITGELIKELAPRNEIVLATKVFGRMRPGPNGQGLSRKAILSEIDNSLRRLGTDFVDLYQIHRFDAETPIEETLEALHDVVKAGKARYIGASSMFAWQFAKMLLVAEANGWTRFVSMQDHLNLMYREEEREMLPLCVDQGIGVIPWSPMARGRLARPWGENTERTSGDAFGKRLYSASDDANRQINEAVAAIAQSRGVPMAQVALAWVLQKQPVTAPIVGATKFGHVTDAVGALEIELTAEEIGSLEAPYRPTGIAGFG